MHKLAKLIATLAFLAIGGPSYAVVTFNLDTEFSGGANPQGTSPWVTATFADTVADTVSLTINASNLATNNFITSVYFNYDAGGAGPTLASLVFSAGTAVVGTITNPTKSTGSNAFMADGDGNFDIKFDYQVSNSPMGGRFSGGETWSGTISGTGLTESMFNSGSVGGSKGSFLMAAHIQGIASSPCNDGSPACTSGWVGAIPEPEIYAMMMAGLGLMGFIARRRKQQLAAA